MRRTAAAAAADDDDDDEDDDDDDKEPSSTTGGCKLCSASLSFFVWSSCSSRLWLGLEEARSEGVGESNSSNLKLLSAESSSDSVMFSISSSCSLSFW